MTHSTTLPRRHLLAQRPAQPGLDVPDDFRLTAGWSVPLVDLRLVDESLHTLPRDGKAVGEVVVRAPWLTQGYRGNAEASEALWQGGYLHTQDMGRIDATGCLRLVDRIKDVIKTGGEWVSSLDLEQLLATHPGVAEAAVIGKPDPVALEVVKAFVSLKDGYEASETLRRELLGFGRTGQCGCRGLTGVGIAQRHAHIGQHTVLPYKIIGAGALGPGSQHGRVKQR